MNDTNDNNSIVSVDGVSSDASFSAHLNSGLSRVFRTPSLRPMQQVAINSIICDPAPDGKLIVVGRTGGGNSLILFMTVNSVGGILLVVILLLSLTANQLSRIKKAAQGYGIITAHHLDDTSSMDLEKKIILRMDTFSYHSSSLMLLLCSPQYLAEDSK